MTAALASDFAERVLDGEGRVLVRFWADWCVPCHAMAPVIAAVAEAHGIELVEVDTEENQDLVSRYDVLSIPTVILFEGGEVQRIAAGPMPRRQLERKLGLTD